MHLGRLCVDLDDINARQGKYADQVITGAGIDRDLSVEPEAVRGPGAEGRVKGRIDEPVIVKAKCRAYAVGGRVYRRDVVVWAVDRHVPRKAPEGLGHGLERDDPPLRTNELARQQTEKAKVRTDVDDDHSRSQAPQQKQAHVI